MTEGTTGEADVLRLRQELSGLLRRKVLEAVEAVLEEELAEALGTGRYERSVARRGYRNGHEARRLTTEVGTQTLRVPRGRIVEEDGSRREFQSQVTGVNYSCRSATIISAGGPLLRGPGFGGSPARA